MANTLSWKDVGVNFSDVNSAMGNAMKGISDAGTVFGKLRQSILDEEQKEWDRQYKEAVQVEAIREFDLKQQLDLDKFERDKARDKVADQHWEKEHQWDGDKAKADIAYKNALTSRVQLSADKDSGQKLASQTYLDYIMRNDQNERAFNDTSEQILKLEKEQSQLQKEGKSLSPDKLSSLDNLRKTYLQMQQDRQSGRIPVHASLEEAHAFALQAAAKASGGYVPSSDVTKFVEDSLKTAREKTKTEFGLSVEEAKKVKDAQENPEKHFNPLDYGLTKDDRRSIAEARASFQAYLRAGKTVAEAKQLAIEDISDASRFWLGDWVPSRESHSPSDLISIRAARLAK